MINTVPSRKRRQPTERRKYSKFRVWEESSSHIRQRVPTTQPQDDPSQKPAKGSEQTFLHRRREMMVDRPVRRCRTPSVIPKCRSNPPWDHRPPTTVAQITKSSVGEDSALMRVACRLAAPHPLGRGTCTGPRGTGCARAHEPRTPAFRAALSTKATRWKSHHVDGRMGEQTCSGHTTEYCSAGKGNQVRHVFQHNEPCQHHAEGETAEVTT